MHVVLNRVGERESEQAEATVRNLEQSCRQFLDRSLGTMRIIPDDPLISSTSEVGKTLISAHPTSACTQEFLALAQQLMVPHPVYPLIPQPT
ncbi:MAG: MinD/ParA family protein [Planctomycetota bacterium]